MVLRLLLIVLSAAVLGAAVYTACALWPLSLDRPTSLIAGIGSALGTALVLAVFIDSKTGTKEE